MTDNKHPVRLVCGNCGTIETHESWEAADAEGWDTVAKFGYNACPSCPGVSVYLPTLYCQQARLAISQGREDEGYALFDRAADATMEFHPRFPRED